MAAVLVIPVVVIEQSGDSASWKTSAAVVNWAIWLAFAAEFVTMMSVSPSRSEWLRSHPLEVAIVLLTPPFLPASLAALRLFRLLRVFRVAVVAVEFRRLLTPRGIQLAFVIASTAALGGGAIFADVERGHSTWDGVWWAVTTMATVGYGDLSPETVTGRLIGLTLMFVGVGFFALVTGAVAQRFIATDVAAIEAEERQIEATEIASREQVLAELKALTVRLQGLEEAVKRL